MFRRWLSGKIRGEQSGLELVSPEIPFFYLHMQQLKYQNIHLSKYSFLLEYSMLELNKSCPSNL